MVVTHRIAQCQDCDWEEHDYIRAYQKAVYHSKKTGHEVHTETAYVIRTKNGRSLTSNKSSVNSEDGE